jgi:hypothetical protein
VKRQLITHKKKFCSNKNKKKEKKKRKKKEIRKKNPNSWICMTGIDC